MNIIKAMLSNLTEDKRVLVLILAWGFGGFLEGVAGFGTAVAIPAAIMISMGFNPLFSALVCLISNTVAVAFGAVGLPVTTLAALTGLSSQISGFTISLQLLPFIIVIPFLLVVLTSKSMKSFKQIWPVALASGGGFAVPQLLITYFIGPELPVIIGSVSSITCTVLASKLFLKEKDSFEHSLNYDETTGTKKITEEKVKYSVNQYFIACLSFILIFVFVFSTSLIFPALNKVVASFTTVIPLHYSHGKTLVKFAWLGCGTMIFIAAVIGALVQGSKPNDLIVTLGETVRQLRFSIITILCIVTLSKIMSHSGMINSIAVGIASITGNFYPFFAPIIGGIGTFITGSDTSSNILFGKLQLQVATQLNMTTPETYWIVSSNTAGATIGKMISPQSIAIAAASCGLVGLEGKILSSVLKYFSAFVVAMGLLIFMV